MSGVLVLLVATDDSPAVEFHRDRARGQGGDDASVVVERDFCHEPVGRRPPVLPRRADREARLRTDKYFH